MKKRNQVFNFLEALAIIMVIDDHMSTRIGILSSIFPYNSFYMPLFVFISGYFYREQKIGVSIPQLVYRLSAKVYRLSAEVYRLPFLGIFLNLK